MSQLFSVLLGASAATVPVSYAELDADLSAMKQTVVQSLSSTYQGDALETFEEFILRPVVALIGASRGHIKDNISLRVHVRNYYSLVVLSLGDCDLCYAAKNDPTIKYSIIEPVLKKIVQHKESFSTLAFTKKKKECAQIMDALEKAFGAHFDGADLLANSHA